jgi:hypothetical protein
MPIVFVHGVNNRHGPAYRAGTLTTQGLLQRHLVGIKVGGKTLAAIPEVFFPYWGDLATKFAWNMASLPRADMQALGVATDPAIEPAVGQVRDGLGRFDNEPLTALAKKRLSLAVDVLSHMALETAAVGQRGGDRRVRHPGFDVRRGESFSGVAGRRAERFAVHQHA